MPGVSCRLTCVALGFAGFCCTPPRRPLTGSTPNLVTERSAVTAPQQDPRHPVRVRLLDCASIEPVAFEETLPDGRVVPSVGGYGRASVRLYLQIDSLTDRPLVVAICNGALAIVPDRSPKPFCGPAGLDDWLALPPAGSVFLYPTIDRPIPAEGTFTERLVPNFGHAPIVDWPAYILDPVSFELTSTGCRPRNAE